MPQTSTVPALKSALKTSLKARPALKNVYVGWGWPRSPAREMVLLGDAQGQQVTAAMRGPSARHVRRETYSLEAVIYIERGGSDQEGATTRAYEIAAELENELRDDPTVGTTVQSAVVGGPFQLEERADPKGQARLAILTFTVEVTARLT